MNIFKKRLVGVILAASMLTITACENGGTSTESTVTEDLVADITVTTDEVTERAEESESTEETSVEVVSLSESVTKPVVEYKTIFLEDFESGESGFGPRGGETVKIVDDGYESEKSLIVTNRTATWNGAQVDLTSFMEKEKPYEISAMVKYEGAAPQKIMSVTLEVNGTTYLSCGSVSAKSGEWIRINGSIDVPKYASTMSFYFESEYKELASEDDLVDLYIDNVEVKEITVIPGNFDVPPLYSVHEDYFTVGIASGPEEMEDEYKRDIILKHFNSMTIGNEMKPDYILDYRTNSKDIEKYNLEPAINTESLEACLKMAKENNIKLRGHTLVWHEQTPEWFFKVGYSKAMDAELASKEVMLARLESYIKQVVEFCDTNYPGVVYCWDVVNEAMLPGDGDKDGFRVNTSLWYQTVGPEFVEAAFTFARKYAAPEVKLFYNDFNTYETSKLYPIYNLVSDLYSKGVLDGVGLQSHIGMESPSIVDYQSAITKLGEIGCEIHITELDVNLDSNDEESLKKLGVKYKKLANMYRFVNDSGAANITNVTIWGLSDKGSWLNKDGKKYPVLFDDYMQPKDAFWGFYLDDAIANY